MNLAGLGTRIDYAGRHGTVKYVGEVHNSAGDWLGVEWDDPHRGKHDGVYDGRRYFHCQVPGAASFIRPSARISFGRSFLDALFSKYIEALHGSGSQENVILGSSNGTIQVEAVGLDKIRGKLSDIGQLREVSLQGVSASSSPGTILKTCPNIRGLDLSGSLLPSWDTVASITSELPVLERLALNQTRLLLLTDIKPLNNAFLNLIELQLNRTMTTWPALTTIISIMPRLRLVEMGYNRLSRLLTNESSTCTSIQTINLDGNECGDWINLCDCFGKYPSLRRVLVTTNRIDFIPFPIVPQQQIPGIKQLALSFNRLKSWRDIDAIASWCPNLETLMLGGNPLAVEMEKYIRPFTVAKIPSLKVLDGSVISQKEREDCELFYLSHIAQDTSVPEEQVTREHPRWPELHAKYGQVPDGARSKTAPAKLRDRIITLKVSESTTPGVETPLPSYTVLNVLPSMTLRTLRLKVCKSVKGRATKNNITLWQRMQGGLLVELGHTHDTQDLSWLGLEDGSLIVYAFRNGE
ncbi:hypothetical protein AX17_003325 [Amanita inopinata Kibby_2008]|nr:hypothetical protein AX17_003325 [Amanita inopinata Kibby_2008]